MQPILRAFYFLALFLFPKNGNGKSATKILVFSVAATIFIQIIDFTALCSKPTFLKTGKKEYFVLFRIFRTFQSWTYKKYVRGPEILEFLF